MQIYQTASRPSYTLIKLITIKTIGLYLIQKFVNNYNFNYFTLGQEAIPRGNITYIPVGGDSTFIWYRCAAHRWRGQSSVKL